MPVAAPLEGVRGEDTHVLANAFSGYERRLRRGCRGEYER
jgi:hypothetical protein